MTAHKVQNRKFTWVKASGGGPSAKNTRKGVKGRPLIRTIAGALPLRKALAGRRGCCISGGPEANTTRGRREFGRRGIRGAGKICGNSGPNCQCQTLVAAADGGSESRREQEA